MKETIKLAAKRLAVGLVATMAVTGATVVASPAASASPPYFLYTSWGGNCTKGSPVKHYDAAIPRYKYDEKHIRFIYAFPTGYSHGRERAFNLARVEAVCTRGQGPGVWKWWKAHYGLERGKVSRLEIGKHRCGRSGPSSCGSAHTVSYGAWRAGWTHEKL